MCEKCDDLDFRIKMYRHLAQSVSSPEILEKIGKSIVDLEAQKTALHSKPESRRPNLTEGRVSKPRSDRKRTSGNF